MDPLGAMRMFVEIVDQGSLTAAAGRLHVSLPVVVRTLAALERDLIARAIRDHHGNLAAAGRALGIERNLLYYKLRKYGFRT